MTFLDAILLGLIQGLTEFLPVSSSGHLALLRLLRGGQSYELSVAFDVVLHLATLLSVLIAFRKSIWRMLTEDRRSIGLIILSTSLLGLAMIPIPGLGKLKDVVEQAGQKPLYVACGFLYTAALLSLMTWLQRRQKPEDQGPENPSEDPQSDRKEAYTPTDALIIGALQLGALFPGVSRSGSTIAGGLLRGGQTQLAFDYAFLLSIPAILGAVVIKAKDIATLSQVQTGPLIAGSLTALITGILAIGMVRWLLIKDRFWLFIPYLLICAGLTLTL